eukprot:1132556-Ditylum_brightwellii.AAC.1
MMARKYQCLLPAASIHLTANDNVISRSYVQEIVKAYMSLLMRANMEKKFRWNINVWDNIDETIHNANLI